MLLEQSKMFIAGQGGTCNVSVMEYSDICKGLTDNIKSPFMQKLVQ